MEDVSSVYITARQLKADSRQCYKNIVPLLKFFLIKMGFEHIAELGRPLRSTTKDDLLSELQHTTALPLSTKHMYESVRACLPNSVGEPIPTLARDIPIATRIYGKAPIDLAIEHVNDFVIEADAVKGGNILVLSTPDYEHLDELGNYCSQRYRGRVIIVTRGNNHYIQRKGVDLDSDNDRSYVYNSYTLPNAAIMHALGYENWGNHDHDPSKVSTHWLCISQDLAPTIKYLPLLSAIAGTHCDIKSLGLFVPRVHDLMSVYDMIDPNSNVAGLNLANFFNYGHNNAFTLRQTVPFVTTTYGALNWNNIRFPRFADGFGFTQVYNSASELVQIGGNEDQALLLMQLAENNPLLGVNMVLVPSMDDLHLQYGVEVPGADGKTIRRSSVMHAYVRRVSATKGIPDHLLYGRLIEHIENGTYWIIADESNDSQVCLVRPGIDPKSRIKLTIQELNTFIEEQQVERVRSYDSRLLI